jgi:WD40 repeat protein
MRFAIALVGLTLVLSVCRGDLPDAPKDQIIRRDGNGDPLPNGAIQRYGSVRFRAGAEILKLQYTLDGKYIVGLSSDRLTVWDSATGVPIRVVGGEGFCLMTFTRDGQQVIVISPTHAQRFEIGSGKKIDEIEFGDSEDAFIDALSPDGQFVVTSRRESEDRFELRIWRLGSPSTIASRLLTHVQRRPEIAWSTDASMIAIGYPTGQVELWDGRTFKKIREIKPGPNYVAALAWSPDGRRLAIGGHEKSGHCWDLASGKDIIRSNGQVGWKQIQFSSDGKSLVTADDDIQVWDAASGALRTTIGHVGFGVIRTIAVSPDGRDIAVAANHGIVTVVSATGDQGPVRNTGHRENVLALRLSPDERRLATASPDGTVITWDVESGNKLSSQSFESIGRPWLVSSPGGDLGAAFARSDGMKLFDLKSAKLVRSFHWPEPVVQSVTSANGLYLAAITNTGAANVWDSKTRKALLQLSEANDYSNPILSPSGRFLALRNGSENSIELWDVATSRLCGTVSGLQGHFAYTNNEREVAAYSESSGIQLLETASCGKILDLKTLRHDLVPAAISPNGRVLATVMPNSSEISLWNLETGELIRAIDARLPWPEAVTFSSDGERLFAARDDQTVLCWNVGSKSKLAAPTKEQVKELVEKLHGADASAAYRAAWLLRQAPLETVAELRRQIKPANSLNEARVNRLIAELDDDKFSIRTAASRELIRLGATIETRLRRVRSDTSSANQRHELNRILERLKGPYTDVEALFVIRSIGLLEMIQSPESQALLGELAGGYADALLTGEAKAAIARLQSSTMVRK